LRELVVEPVDLLLDGLNLLGPLILVSASASLRPLEPAQLPALLLARLS